MSLELGEEFAKRCRVAGEAVQEALDKGEMPSRGWQRFDTATYPDAQEVREIFEKVCSPSICNTPNWYDILTRYEDKLDIRLEDWCLLDAKHGPDRRPPKQPTLSCS